MRKIKKFRIPLYHYDIYRKAKKIKLDIDNSHFKGQEGLKEFVSVLYSHIEPCVIFDYIGSDSPLWMRLNLESKQSGATLGLITFSSSFSEKINTLTDELEKSSALLASHVILNSAVSLVSDLAQEEAKNDGFTLSKPYFIYVWDKDKMDSCVEKEFLLDFEEDFLKEILIRLEAEKNGVNIENGVLSPEYSALFMLPWLSRKKK